MGPILGDGKAVGYRSKDGAIGWFGHQDGAVTASGFPDRSMAPSRPARLPRARPPVAVLTSRLTGSAGEGVAIAFPGLPSSRPIAAPRLGNEFDEGRPDWVITLGDEPLRALGRKRLSAHNYGVPLVAGILGHRVRLLRLAHTRQQAGHGASSSAWASSIRRGRPALARARCGKPSTPADQAAEPSGMTPNAP